MIARIAIVLLLAVMNSAASGQIVVPSTGGVPSPASFAAIRVDGQTIFEISGGAGLDAPERAVPINHRLEMLVERNSDPPHFSAKDLLRRQGETLLTLGGEPILTVTNEDAKEALTNTDELALDWGQKLTDAIVAARAARANPFIGVGPLIRTSSRDLVLSGIKWLPRLVGALIVWTFFWSIAKIVRMVATRATMSETMDSNLRQLIRSMSYYGTWMVGVVIILSTLGLDGSSLAAGLGISGFVLGFAFKDILSHLFAGLMLLTGRQFHIGDQIVVKDYEGTVERIELRALFLRTYDNRMVIIPNGDVFTSTVISNTASPLRRREIVIGISYQDDISRAQQVALETVRAVSGVAEDPTADVLVDELTTAGVKLRIRFHTNSQRADYLRVGSECMSRLKDAFKESGISLPTGTQTIVIGNLDVLRPTSQPTVEESK